MVSSLQWFIYSHSTSLTLPLQHCELLLCVYLLLIMIKHLNTFINIYSLVCVTGLIYPTIVDYYDLPIGQLSTICQFLIIPTRSFSHSCVANSNAIARCKRRHTWLDWIVTRLVDSFWDVYEYVAADDYQTSVSTPPPSATAINQCMYSQI